MTDPTAAPNLLSGLPHVGRAPVLVTGGTGTLGRAVVRELLDSDVPAKVLTRRADAGTDAQVCVGDLRTGAGLSDAVQNVQAVIHCATDPHGHEVDVDGLERLCNALAENNPDAHLVHVSIVGCWDSPLPYYRVKAEAERVVGESKRPYTIVRATQFHEFVERICGVHVGPIGVGLRGLRFAPCDTAWVGRRLVDVALETTPTGGTVELAGPEVLSARDIAVLTAHLSGRPTPHQVQLPRVGRVLTALGNGSNLPGDQAVRGGRSYAQWWADRASE
ncbi:SDR family oxidoreductase [Allobranchiibius sp. GilTou73]|uniref:SDR family oxidoreductase n=1 Tax=Allobranchiibius sp. GilTou73 TaxID=2904523 RepID=UPI001F3296CE|nr:SDR family oxidoreductase [Allobranchiibius sp. GilTou73]UIJ34617.1 SDR family oxidoreductase [Allobranchiibius sp. GilTou73]